MIRGKYGDEFRSRGDPDLGEVESRWRFPDGVGISVYRGWPDTAVYLRYEMTRNLRAYEEESHLIESKMKQVEVKVQDQAF